jgi:hypothetical protein
LGKAAGFRGLFAGLGPRMLMTVSFLVTVLMYLGVLGVGTVCDLCGC